MIATSQAVYGASSFANEVPSVGAHVAEAMELILSIPGS